MMSLIEKLLHAVEIIFEMSRSDCEWLIMHTDDRVICQQSHHPVQLLQRPS